MKRYKVLVPKFIIILVFVISIAEMLTHICCIKYVNQSLPLSHKPTFVSMNFVRALRCYTWTEFDQYSWSMFLKILNFVTFLGSYTQIFRMAQMSPKIRIKSIIALGLWSAVHMTGRKQTKNTVRDHWQKLFSAQCNSQWIGYLQTTLTYLYPSYRVIERESRDAYNFK